jgi:hypothetical protein
MSGAPAEVPAVVLSQYDCCSWQGEISAEVVSEEEKQQLDADALSRSLAVHGFRAQLRLSKSTVLICGMGGLG